ncbi:K02A2.6-like [Cordylochernes scorpioides]|uniref:K02A2.6-like n=1 Tax=Cordylochernes scorpioides TaxID=51811 RepID=A0ABY6K1Q0_9ARAC|nr:K02A2.6-like [Cordylochernes scorpioides]
MFSHLLMDTDLSVSPTNPIRTVQTPTHPVVCFLCVSENLSATVHPPRQAIEAGGTAVFNCSVHGYPVRTVNWLKDGRPATGPRVEALQPRGLRVRAVRREDQGIYQCYVLGEGRDSAQGSALLLLAECEKLSGAASNGGEVDIEENPPGYIAAKLKENFVMVEINGRKIKALVDSGADFSVISDKFRRELKTPLFKEPGPILKAANKNLIETLGKCVLNIEVNGLNISFEFVVMVECSHDIIFGWDFFKATEAVIDCGRNELHLGETSVLESREEENQRLFASDDFVIPPKSKKISVMNEEICGVRDVLVSTSKDLLLRKEVLIPNSVVTFRHGRGSIWVANGASWPQLIPAGMNMCTMESYENGNICSLIESSDKLQETQLKSREWSQKINLTLDPGLSEIQRLQLVSCHDEFIGIFDFGSTPIKPTSTVKHKINTGDQTPIKQRPYRVAPSERRLIQDEVNKMIENHIVKPSESPWSSPVILVRKKDGTWRFCVDYRRLNKITKKDVYPLPRIDDSLDSLAGSSYFYTMDLRSGYWQIEVDEKDREKTAFITPDGLYEFQVIPFGLCNAPATFERMIDSVLGSLKWNMCLCYLDDIVVYAPTFEEHLRRLQLVLSCIQKAGLSLNHKKYPKGNVAPRISSRFSRVTVAEGDTLEVPCAGQGAPPPQYRWYRDQPGVPLAGPRVFHAEGTLFIQQAMRQDAGRYLCVVNNTMGSESAATEVIVTSELVPSLLYMYNTY